MDFLNVSPASNMAILGIYVRFQGGSHFLFVVLFIYNIRLFFVQRQHTKKDT